MAWEKLPMEVLKRGMTKHVLTPATTDPATPPPPADASWPPVPAHVDEALAALSSLALPVEAEEDSNGQENPDPDPMEEDGPEDNADGESSDDSSDDGGPIVCVKCSDPIEPNRRVQCPHCGIILHPRCMSVNSKGKCCFC